jgi:hypothetical protein
MIFNPVRSGGEKEYTITANNLVTTSATKLKPGYVFEATSRQSSVSPKMTFVDPATGNMVNIRGTNRTSNFVMPCADVTLS